MARARFVSVLLLLFSGWAFAQDSSALWKRWNDAEAAKDWKKAAQAMREGMKAWPEEMVYPQNLAWALRQDKRAPEAVSLLEAVLAKHPSELRIQEALAWSLLDVGWACYDAGQQAKAYETFSRAWELLPDDASVANAWGCVLRDTGRLDEAVSVLRSAYGKWPEDRWIKGNLAAAIRGLKPPSRGAELLEPLFAAHPEDRGITEAFVYSLLDSGWESFEAGKPAEAALPFERAWKILPEDQYVANAWGCVLRDTGRVDEAIPVLTDAYGKWPENEYIKPNLVYALVKKADSLSEIGDPGAEAYYLRAGKLDGNDEGFLLNYGWHLVKAKRFDEALQYLEKCLALHPANAWVRSNIQYALQERVRAMAASGDYAGALREGRAASARYPGEIWFLEDIIEYAMKLKDWAEADRTLRSAVALKDILDYGKPYSGDKQDLFQYRLSALAWKYAELGQFDRGFSLIDAVDKAFPGAYWVADIRGILRFHSGDKARGIAEVNAVYDVWIREHPEWAEPLLLDLPLRGTLLVWGNSRPDSVTHAGMNRFCFDFLGSDASGSIMKPGTASPGRNGDYWGFGRDILSVCEGRVESVEDGFPDIEPRLLPILGDGNAVVVADSLGRHYNYVHLRKGSAAVKVGDRVVIGQKLGEMGNSGYTAVPHFHFGVYSPDWRVSLPLRFRSYEVHAADGSWEAATEAVPETGAIIRN